MPFNPLCTLCGLTARRSIDDRCPGARDGKAIRTDTGPRLVREAYCFATAEYQRIDSIWDAAVFRGVRLSGTNPHI